MGISRYAEALSSARIGSGAIDRRGFARLEETGPRQQALDDRPGDLERRKFRDIPAHDHNQIVPGFQSRVVEANRFPAQPLGAVALMGFADSFAGHECIAVLSRFELVWQHADHDGTFSVRPAARANLAYLEFVAESEFPGNHDGGVRRQESCEIVGNRLWLLIPDS